ncbi:unnamed protein product, partial [Vitis vinifera]
MIPGGAPYGGLDLQGATRIHHHQHPHNLHQQHHSHSRQGTMNHSSIHHEVFPLTMGSMQDCDQSISMADYNKGEKGKALTSDEDEPSFNEDAIDGHNDPNRGKKGRKYAILQKKGKWKSVSKVMAERGHYVSPQQCEDKFNDLNKRYKRLNDVLGRGTSCQVVENPALLDMMDHLTEKTKEDVRKILSSKHLFYEEMCSYHNGNRLHLPPDPALQRSLQLALRSRDEHDNRVYGMPVKRMKQGQNQEDFSFGNPSNSQDCNRSPHPQSAHVDMNQVYPVGSAEDLLQKQWMRSRSLQLEEQKLQIQEQMLELEKQRFKWQRFCRKKDRDLDKLRMENERMKLENERMALELKRKEMGASYN